MPSGGPIHAAVDLGLTVCILAQALALHEGREDAIAAALASYRSCVPNYISFFQSQVLALDKGREDEIAAALAGIGVVTEKEDPALKVRACLAGWLYTCLNGPGWPTQPGKKTVLATKQTGGRVRDATICAAALV